MYYTSSFTKFNLVFYGILLKLFGNPVHSDIETCDCHMSPSAADSIIDLTASIDMLGPHLAFFLCSLIHPLLKIAAANITFRALW